MERFRIRSDGRIRRIEAAPGNSRTRRKASPITASLRTAKAMRPARNEIVVCTRLNPKETLAFPITGLFCQQ